MSIDEQRSKFVTLFEEILRDNFEKVDYDGDGFVNYKEFSGLLNKYELKLSPTYEIERKFSKHDANNDKRVSLNEYIHYVKKSDKFELFTEKFVSVFKSIDKLGHGYISSSELRNYLSKDSGALTFNEKGLDNLVKNFDIDSDKKITLEADFCFLFKLRWFKMNKNQETYNYIFYYENVLRDDFRKADLNGDGFIDFNEFSRLLNKYGVGLISTYDIERSFANHDANHDGRVSVDEFINYVKHSNKFEHLIDEYTLMFKSMDKDGNGYIHADEVKRHWQENGINLSDQGIQSIIKSFDLDSDRRINLQEYLNALTMQYFKGRLYE